MQRKDFPLRTLISGISHSLRVFSIPGTQGGPKAYLQAGLHAGELQGIGVLKILLDYFQKHPPLGDITLVPVANPFALDVKMGEYTYGRFDPVTGENWNRQFSNLLETLDLQQFVKDHAALSGEQHRKPFKKALGQALDTLTSKENTSKFYGKTLAFLLQRLALDADIALDLHADSKSLPYVYSPAYAAPSARFFNKAYVIQTPFAFSPCFNQACFYPWWALSQATGEAPLFESFTLELGNKESFDIQEAQAHAHDILNYLRHKGVAAGDANIPPEPIYAIEEDLVRVYAPRGGLVSYDAPLGHMIQAGDPWVSLLTLEDMKLHTTSAPCQGIPLTYTSSSAVHEGNEIAKILKLS